MRRYHFEDYKKLSDYIVENAQNGFYTVTVLFYDDALALLRELIRYKDVNIEALDIKPVEYDGYDKEYYVSLADDMVASVEPAYVGDRYLNAEADLTLIVGDASSAIIKNLPANKCREIYIGNADDETEDYNYVPDCSNNNNNFDRLFENAELLKDKDDKIIGIQMDVESLFKYLLNLLNTFFHSID